jgi:hypothetical protein
MCFWAWGGNGGRRQEDRRQKAEDRRQETEGRRQEDKKTRDKEIKRLGVQKGGNVVLDRRVVIEHLAV